MESYSKAPSSHNICVPQHGLPVDLGVPFKIFWWTIKIVQKTLLQQNKSLVTEPTPQLVQEDHEHYCRKI